MADIAPLFALRYDIARLSGTLEHVVAPPYDVISPAQRAELAARHPHNVVRLELPDGDEATKYLRAGELLRQWCDEGVLVRDRAPAFYRYEQTFSDPGRRGGPTFTRRGFFGLVRLVPFSAGVVLPHERTLSGPKQERLKLLRATAADVSPGFMLYRDPQREVDSLLETAEPICAFTTPDGVSHSLAAVEGLETIRRVVDGIRPRTLLIADGHHRYETALQYAREVAAACPVASDRAEHLFFLTYLVNGDDPGLVVFPTHRHVHSLASFSFDRMLARAADAFVVSSLPTGAEADVLLAALSRAAGRGPSVVAAAGDGRAALLTLRGDIDLSAHPTLAAQPAVLRRTDVTMLHAGILEQILGITPEAQAAKTNVWYRQDVGAALGELRAGKGDVLFAMNPTTVAQVRDVAESGEVMPQKSTFFYPKVPTGLLLHTLDPSRMTWGE
jgi:uncharacterized protein (DUF1015 family)